MGVCNNGSDFPVSSRDDNTPAHGPEELPHETLDIGRGPCPGSKPVIDVWQNQKTAATLYVFDKNGEAVDLSSGQFVVRLITKDWEKSNRQLLNLRCKIDDANIGKVSLTFTPNNLALAGIFVAQLCVYTADQSTLLWTTPYWLVVNTSLDVASWRTTAPITIAEVRLILRDVCPGQNILLDALEFSDAEVVAMMRHPVDEFNEKYKPTTSYTMRNFPFRFHWLRAAGGYLLEMAARAYARNKLPYQAGGLTINDQDKVQEYLALGKDLVNEWRQFIRDKKIELNLEGGFNTAESAYRYTRSSRVAY